MPLINNDRLARTIARVGRYAAIVGVTTALLGVALLAYALLVLR